MMMTIMMMLIWWWWLIDCGDDDDDDDNDDAYMMMVINRLWWWWWCSMVTMMMIIMVILMMKQRTVNAIWSKKNICFKYWWQISATEIYVFNTYLKLSLRPKSVLAIHILNFTVPKKHRLIFLMTMFSIVNQKQKNIEATLWCDALSSLVQYIDDNVLDGQ